MSSFLNLELDGPVNKKFLVRHLLYCVIWILGISVFVLRLDYNLVKYLSPDYEWIIKTIPFAIIISTLLIMFKTKWYYNLVLIFYPLLLMFWFLPKLILQKGKIYLLSNYLSYIFKRIKKFKKSIILLSVFIVTVFILTISDSNVVRIISMIIMSFYYYKYLLNYIKATFRPAQLFGETVENAIDEFLNTPNKKFTLVESIESTSKKDDKLSDEEKINKKLKSLIVFNFLIETFGNNLKGFKGKKAFVISWLYQLIGFSLISITFFTFLNFELFLVDKNSFTIKGNPSLFDFIYYTLKTITYNNTADLIPYSVVSKVIETFTFLTLGVFLFVFVTSIIYTLKQDRINENIKKATDLCIYQNQAIAEHIKINYQTDIITVLNDMANIKSSLLNIKRAVERLF